MAFIELAAVTVATMVLVLKGHQHGLTPLFARFYGVYALYAFGFRIEGAAHFLNTVAGAVLGVL